MSDASFRGRLAFSAGLLALCLVGLGVRLAFLHLLTPDTVRRSFTDKREIERTLAAPRGMIFDCAGQENPLAMNLAVNDVCIDPSAIAKSNAAAAVAACLAEGLGLSRDELMGKLAKTDKHFALVKRAVHPEEVRTIRKSGLPGVFFPDNTVRFYPHGEFLCHVLGFVNFDGVGSAGTEQTLDRYLRGSPGYVESKVNALRQELYTARGMYVPPLPGANACLTIDQTVQHIVEKVIDEVMAEHGARGASIIVQRIRTGEILAMASRPAYDLNNFRSADANVLLNRAVGVVYEPGSTFKAVAISAALNEGTVRPETVFDCENGAWVYAKRVLHDYHPYGRLTVADGLKKSSNILTAKVALTLGNDRLYKYLRAYGVGGKLGFDLPGEEGGILPRVPDWSAITPTRIPIGQGVAVTALQMLNIYCAIANDGFLMRPYVISKVIAEDGSTLLNNSPQVLGRPISSETASTMRYLLSRVTEEGGTGTRAQVDGYTVAGKTGTAQKPVGGVYSSSAYVANFVGFLPAEKPEIGIIVVVDEPQKSHLGGSVAAPAFGRIANQVVRYFDIPPTLYGVARNDTGTRNLQ